jgi:hypothetical protein
MVFVISSAVALYAACLQGRASRLAPGAVLEISGRIHRTERIYEWSYPCVRHRLPAMASLLIDQYAWNIDGSARNVMVSPGRMFTSNATGCESPH